MNLERAMTLVTEALQRGALLEAETHCRFALALDPKNFQIVARLGEILLQAGKRTEAMEAFEEASRLRPDHSQLFTGAAIMRFRATFGDPPPPRPNRSDTPRIQMSTLGVNGRFGNQLLQYAFVRLYAKEHNLTAELPQWIGRDIFDLDDPLPSARLPVLGEKHRDVFALLSRGTGTGLAEKDIVGFFCGDTSQWGARRDAFRALFTPGPKIAPLLDGALQRLRAEGKTLVVLHLRTGDFGYGEFWKAPPSWYLRWLRDLWPRLDAPLLYIAAEDGNLVQEFEEFSPWDASRLGVTIPGASFMVDHHVMRFADYLAISNSTFSFTAAMLNEIASEFMRPAPGLRKLMPFDPWASPVLLRAPVEAGERTKSERYVLRKLFSDQHNVLYVGQYCAPWTNLARATHSSMMVHEIEAGTAVDDWRKHNDVAHIRHLVIENHEKTAEIFAGAETTLREGRIATVHISLTEGQDLSLMLAELPQYGFSFFRVAGETKTLTPIHAPAGRGRYVAILTRQTKIAE